MAGLAGFLRKVGWIALKDLRTESRTREVFTTMVAFSALAVVVMAMAFDLRVPKVGMLAPGVLWIVVLFAGVLGLNRSFGAEVDRGSLSALLLAPVDRSAIYFGKVLANLAFIAASEVLLLPMILILFDVNLFRLPILAALLLGTIGYVAVGTLFAALASSARARESLLPVLLLPVMIPIFLAGVGLTANVVDGLTGSAISRWFSILIGYDLIFITLAYLLFDLIWEES